MHARQRVRVREAPRGLASLLHVTSIAGRETRHGYRKRFEGEGSGRGELRGPGPPSGGPQPHARAPASAATCPASPRSHAAPDAPTPLSAPHCAEQRSRKGLPVRAD
eukprot:609140-Rhodomonas_salina.1